MDLKENSSSTQSLMTRDQVVALLCIALLAGVALLRAVFLKDYVFSKLLVSDDTIFIGTFMSGAPAGGPLAQRAYYTALQLLSSGGSETPPKLFLFVIQAIISICFYRIIFRFGGEHLVAVGLAILAATYPVSVDQNYFMSGAHPVAATAVFLVFCVLFVESLFGTWIRRKRAYFGFLLLQGVLLYICGMCSPTFTLIPLILVLTTILSIAIGPEGEKLTAQNAGLVAASVLPILAYYLTVRHHHYGDLVGWTNPALGQIFHNLEKSIAYIFETPLAKNPIVTIGYVIGFGIILLAGLMSAIRHRDVFALRFDPKLIVVLLVLLASAAFTFGPSSIVTAFTSRYVVAPSLIAFLTLAIVVAVAIGWIQSVSSVQMLSIRAGLALMAVVAVAHNVDNTHRALAPLQRSHALITEALAKLPLTHGDQVLIVLPDGYPTPTSGFNHWSTWYLRTLTGDPDIVGLVGSSEMRKYLNANELFVDKYRDHHPMYWGIADGRSYRKRMKGLERTRPLYVLAPSSPEALAPVPLVFWDKNSFLTVPPGQAPNRSSAVRIGCNMSDLTKTLLVVDDLDIAALGAFQPEFETSYLSDGQDYTLAHVEAPINRFVQLKLVLSSTDVHQGMAPKNKYSSTFPPMPVNGPDFSVYLANGEYRILSKDDGPAKATIPAVADKALNISMLGCPGENAMLFVNGRFVGTISEASFSGDWMLGKGFMERYWAGDISQLSLSFLTEPAEPH